MLLGSMGTTDDSARYYPSYFSAYRQFLPHDGPYYDITGHFVFHPSEVSVASALYDYLHELNHAQLGNGVLGMTIQTLTEILAVMEKQLFLLIREVLEGASSVAPFSYRKLFLFGSLDDQLHRERQVIIACWRFLQPKWKQLLLDENFHQQLTIFERVYSRRREIWKRWIPVQEGIAVLTTIASSQSDEHVTNAIASLSAHLFVKPEVLQRVNQEVRNIGNLEKHRWQHGICCEKPYLKGYDLIQQVNEATGSLSGAWILALAAAHFPYQSCNLLDISDEEFTDWICEGELNVFARAERLSKKTELLKEATEEVDNTGLLSVGTRSRILHAASYRGIPPQLGKDSELFGCWERDYLLRSSTFRQFLGSNGSILDNLAGFESLDTFYVDWQYDFRIAGNCQPPLIDEKGKITVQIKGDIERVKRMFIKTYEVERTHRLINWLKAGPLH